MPERTIETREPTGNRTVGSLADSRNISTRTGTTRGSVSDGRGITTIPSGSAPSEFELTELNRRINAHTGSLGLSYFLGNTTASNPQANDPSGIVPYRPLYGSDNPFQILADAFTRAFGGSVYNPPRESERTVIESAGSGTNWTLLIVLLAIGGGAYLWYRNAS